MKRIAGALHQTNGNNIITAMNATGSYTLNLDGTEFVLTDEDVAVSIQQKEGFVFESYKDLYVALDTHLTDELIAEGYARELVNKIQFTRKEQDFDIMDRIEVRYAGDDEIARVFADFAEYIQAETLADAIVAIPAADDLSQWDINGKPVKYQIIKK
jgi:isoleucyl-tRNA synthetase